MKKAAIELVEDGAEATLYSIRFENEDIIIYEINRKTFQRMYS